MERTKLANERTLLAYVRTSMALIVAGFSMIEFFTSDVYKLVGLAFVPLGVVAGAYGFRRFLKKKQAIHLDQEAYTPTSQAHAAVVQADTREKESRLPRAGKRLSGFYRNLRRWLKPSV